MQPAIYLSEGNSKEPYWWMTRFTYGQFIGNLREIRRIVNELIRDENMESEEAENGKHS